MIKRLFGKRSTPAPPSPLPQTGAVSGASGAEEPEMPFGEDIENPDARELPAPFHGRWCWPDGREAETLAADTMTIAGAVETVVAVRFIDSAAQVAVVTRTAAGDYGLHYRGLNEDGAVLTDLENMDVKLTRC